MQSNFPHPFSVFWWALTLAWAAPIFYVSTQAFTPDLSHALLARTLHMLHLRVSAGTFDFLHSLLRKAAHLTEYSMFALLLHVIPGEQNKSLWWPRRAVICIPVAAAYSLTDEDHQLYIPEDTPLSLIARWTRLGPRRRCWCLTRGNRPPF